MEKAKHDKAEAAIPHGETTRKSNLRARLKASRAAIPADERAAIDAAICERLVETSEYEKCEIILTYLSTEREVDTRDLVMHAIADGKRVALPRCVPGTREMSWHLAKGLDGLVTSSFGIEEPPMKTTPSSALTRSSTPERSPSSLRSPSTKPACASGTEEVSTTRSSPPSPARR